MDKKALWISRHPIDPKAEEDLKKFFELDVIDQKDITFDEDPEMAFKQLAFNLNDYQVFGGVFPAQLWFSIIQQSGIFELEGRKLFEGKTMFLVISKSVAAESAVRTFKYDHFEFLTF